MAGEPEHVLVKRLDAAQIPYELISHPRSETATAEANALGIDVRSVAKTLVLTTPEGFVRAVLPASERLDLRKAERILGTKEVRLANEEMLANEYPEFELGAVPPVAGAHGDRVIADRHLLDADSIVIEAGTHEQSIRLKTSDLLTLAEAELADLCQE